MTAPVAVLLLTVSCVNDKSETLNPEGKVTITASFPETADSKVSMEEAEGGLDLKWKDSDFLTVVGETTETYTIASIAPDGKSATFTGNPVKGETFKVILSDLGEDYLTRDYTQQFNPVSGDDIKGNVPYDAVLDGVSDYTNISFTKEWAEEHNATFSETGVMMLHFQLPEGCENVRYVKIISDDSVFSKNNSSESAKTHYIAADTRSYTNQGEALKVYWPTSMNSDVIPSGSALHVVIEASSGAYAKDYSLQNDFMLMPGKRNILKLNSSNWSGLTLTWIEDESEKSSWTAPYVNFCATGRGPKKLLEDATDQTWTFPWKASNVHYDSSFTDWKELGYSYGEHAVRAPMVAIINLGQSEYIHTFKVHPRADTKWTTTGEIWVSNDTVNDDELDLTASLRDGLTNGGQDRKWPLWREKKWIKVADLNFHEPSEKNVDYGFVQVMNFCCAKYVMLVVHEGNKKNETEYDPGLGEFSLRYYVRN